MRNPVAGLAVVGLGASLAAMDLAVNVAFPSITAAFALETEEIRWIVVCYVLTYASLMLAFGRLGDRIGHRRVFRAGLLVSVGAYTFCALAPTYGWLLVARVIQGVSTALVLSCAPALATALFEESRRTRALGAYGSFTAIAGIVAPVIGGVSIAALGWAGVFWFRVPVALLAAGLLRLIPAQAQRNRGAHRPALAGSLLSAAGLALLLTSFTLALSQRTQWIAAPAALCGIVVSALFLAQQRHDPEPLLPLSATKDMAFVLLNGASVILHFVVFAVPLLVPYYLERIALYAPPASGAALACSPCGVLTGSLFAAAIVRRFGARNAAFAGGTLIVLGQLAIGMWSETPMLALVLLPLFVHGAGMGLFTIAYSDLVLATLPRHERGVAGSLTNLTRTIGVITAATGLTAALSAIESHGISLGQTPAAAFVDAFRRVFVLSALLAAVLLPLCLVRSQASRDRR